jgi:spore maturation protein B
MGYQSLLSRVGHYCCVASGKGMAQMTDYIVPILLLIASLFALRKQANSYDLLLDGAVDGLKLLVTLVPTLVFLLTAVTMLRSSGAMEFISGFLAPVFRFVGIPPETAMLVLVRPISGSAALAIGAELMAEYGVDSLIGRTAAVMLGSTETTFYTISVYFGAAGIRKTRYTIPAALFADFIGFLMASITTRLLYP